MEKDLGELSERIHEFSGLTDDSRKVKNGYIFVAVRGRISDGHEFIPQAVKNGASVVVGEGDFKEIGANYIKVADSRDALGLLASAWYGNPSGKLKVIGVTGTKGKTTTVHLIYHILTALGKKAGLLSSISVPGLHVTSPDVISLHKFLKEMADAGCEYAVIEVSSHGIDQKRIAGVTFEVGVLTNIAPEHLDYHGTLKEYKRVKIAFINSCKHKVIAPKKTEIDILPGKFNNLNIEAALGAVEALGINRDEALKTVYSFTLPKGRLEEVKNDKGFKIFIDFAHTPDSLEAALGYLKTKTSGRLISVFGCAGERDVKKRRKMGKISGEIANLSVFTAEDPRSENVFDIFSSMKKDAKNYVCIPERGEAIAYALSVAKPGDVVGFFGKGHEESMAYKGFEHSWSDRREIENFLDRDIDTSAIILAAGKGARMKSVLPKILHEICGRSMIAYSLQNLRRAKIGEIVTVVSYRKNLVIKKIGGAVKIAVQKNPKGGTADATAAGVRAVSESADSVVVMYGDDTAFYSPETINKVIHTHREANATLTFVTLLKDNPRGLGRIVRDANEGLTAIVEEKDATDEERKIKEINDGMYVFQKKWLRDNLTNVRRSPVTRELYINEFIRLALEQKQLICIYRLPDSIEWQGINTPEELENAKKIMEEELK